MSEHIVLEIQPTGKSCRGCEFFDSLHFCDIFGYMSDPEKKRATECIEAQEWFDNLSEDAMTGGF